MIKLGYILQFQAIAEALNVKAYVSKDKKNILDCLEDDALNKMITQDPNETNLHVVQMGKLNINDLEAYAANFKQYDHVVGMKLNKGNFYFGCLIDSVYVAFKPSGWTHNSSTQNGLSIEKKSKNIIIYGMILFYPNFYFTICLMMFLLKSGLEYSEHSSFQELKNCVTTLKPRKVIPTVNCGSKEKRDKMQAYLDEWQSLYKNQ